MDTGEIQKKKKIKTPRRTQAESTAKLVEKDREHFILIKGALHREDIKFLCALSTGSTGYIKRMLPDTKSQMDATTIIVSVFKSHCHK